MYKVIIKEVSDLRSELEVFACFSNAGSGLMYAIDSILVPESTLFFPEQDVVGMIPNLGLGRLIAETLQASSRRLVPGAGFESLMTCSACCANIVHLSQLSWTLSWSWDSRPLTLKIILRLVLVGFTYQKKTARSRATVRSSSNETLLLITRRNCVQCTLYRRALQR